MATQVYLQTLPIRDIDAFMLLPVTFLPPLELEAPFSGPAPTVEAHLSRAHEVLRDLAKAQEIEALDQKFRQEMTWLAANKHRYAGRWVALDGDRLLAEGVTSKEVFAKVSAGPNPPLVIRIEEEELPFGGW